MSVAEVTIDALGLGGDGIAEHGGRSLYVPLTLPGERWRVRIEGQRGRPIEPLHLEPRATPPCPHFGRCGGCALQHLPDELYRRFKRDRIVTSLARRGLHEVEVADPAVSPPGSRRRLRLAATTAGRRTHLGLRRSHSNRIEPLTTCTIAKPELVAVFEPLGAGLSGLRVSEVSLTATESGVDMGLHGAGDPGLPVRERLAALADELDLARLSWNGEPIAARRQPVVRLSGVLVGLPPDGFLQATAEGEAALTAAVAEWASDARRVVDLYAGLGTLGLALVPTAVHAVEASSASLTALAAAARHMTTESRDLARRPLQPDELKRFDTALIDPPRTGAAEQVASLTASRLRCIVYASCQPETFVRDARTLVDGGFTLRQVRPVDQFLWSPEVELVALFER